MARIIAASIDLTKIEKGRIIDGQKGKYYNITITVNDQPNNYGQDVAIQTQVSKEEREAGTKGAYIGNGKTVWTDSPKQQEPKAEPAPSKSLSEELGGDLPF
jgi:hypothetical protein